MNDLRTNIDNHGKVLIPAKLRKELDFKQGDTLILRRINNELRLISLKFVIANIQEDFKKRAISGQPATEEFLETRQIERNLEKGKFTEYGGGDK